MSYIKNIIKIKLFNYFFNFRLIKVYKLKFTFYPMDKKLLVLFGGMVIFGYMLLFPPGIIPNILAPIIFWVLAFLIILLYPLKQVFHYVVKNFNKKEVKISSIVYFPIHLILFSLAIEKLLSAIFIPPTVIYSSQIGLAYAPFSVIGLGFIFNLLFNPGVLVLLPPYYYLSITPFSIFVALTITFLVSANIGKIFEFLKSFRMISGIIALGLIGGTTCCLSLPTLIAFYTPLSAIAYNSLSGEILTVIYFALPLIVILSLYDLFRKTVKVKYK